MTQETTLRPLSDLATKELLQRRKTEEKLLRKLEEAGVKGLYLEQSIDLLLNRLRTGRRLLLEANAARIRAEVALTDAEFITYLLTQERVEIEDTAKRLGILESFEDVFGAPK